MYLYNLIAAAAAGALSWYLISKRGRLAKELAGLLHLGPGLEKWERVSYAIGGLFLAVVAVSLLLGRP